ncbi:hypothetical protein [Salmonella phage PMBT28]|nr:hypothetical protein [Salmonella phage PMBT28]
MVFDKVKELVLSGLGILAAISCGAAVILYLQLQSANGTIVAQGGTITRLNTINENNREALTALRSDFNGLNAAVTMLMSDRIVAEQRQEVIEAYLKRLEKNDAILKEYLAGKLPTSVGKLFVVDQANGNKDGGAKGPGVVANPVKAPTAAADGKQR